MKSRLLSIVLAISMALSLTPVAYAADGESSGGGDTSESQQPVVATVTIGSTTQDYTNFDEAMSAVTASGGTVTLQSDVNLTKKVTINNDVTLTSAEGDTHKVTGVQGDASVNFQVESGTFTISNVELTEFGNQAGTNSGNAVIAAASGATGKVVAQNVNISAFNRSAYDLRGGSFEITGGKIDAAPSENQPQALTKGILAGLGASTTTGTISGVEISGAASQFDDWSSSAIEVYRNAKVAITGVNIHAVQSGIVVDNYWNAPGGTQEGAQVTIDAPASEGPAARANDDASTTVVTQGSSLSMYGYDATSGNQGSTSPASLTVSGGSYTSTEGNAINVTNGSDNEAMTVSGAALSGGLNGTGAQVRVSQSTISVPTADDIKGVTVDAASEVTDKAGQEVLLTAQIEGGDSYASLIDAVEAAKEGATIILQKDAVLDEKSASHENGDALLLIEKNLTIKGADGTRPTISVGTLTGEQTSMINVLNGVDVTLENFIIEGKNETTSAQTKHGVNIWNHNGEAQGTVTLTNLEVRNNRGYAVVVMGTQASIDGLVTSGNGWGGINVDSRNENSHETEVTFGDGNVITESASIVLDQKDSEGSTAGEGPKTNKVTISGGRYNQIIANPIGGPEHPKNNPSDSNGVNITGGKFAPVGSDPDKNVVNPADRVGDNLAVGSDGTVGAAHEIKTSEPIDNGSVTTSPSGKFAEGGEVTITTTPETGYITETVSVTKASGEEVPVTSLGDNTYTFVGPSEDVTVSASFINSETAVTVEVTPAVGETTTTNVSSFSAALQAVGKNPDDSTVITLNADVSAADIGDAIELKGNITIKSAEGQKYTISGNPESNLPYFSIKGGNITFENVKLTNFGGNAATVSGAAVIKVEDDAADDTQLTVTDVELSNYCRTGVDVRNGTYTISNSTFKPGIPESPTPGNSYLKKGILIGSGDTLASGTIDAVTIIGSGSDYEDWDASGIEIYRYGQATITNPTITNVENGISLNNSFQYGENKLGATVTLEGGTITASNKAVRIYGPAQEDTDAPKASISISGSTLTGDVAVLEAGTVSDNLIGEITLTGADTKVNGTLNGGTGLIVATDGVQLPENAIEGSTGVVLVNAQLGTETVTTATEDYVALVQSVDGGSKPVITAHKSLKEAIEAASEGSTIDLLKSVALDATGLNMGTKQGLLTINKSLTINGNGFALTNTGVTASDDPGKPNNQISMITILNDVDVTINDLTVDGSVNGDGTTPGTRHGLNLWSGTVAGTEPENRGTVALNNVQIKNNVWYAAVVRGYDLVATDLVTEGNSWGIDVDTKIDQLGSSVTLSGDKTSISEASSIVLDQEYDVATSTAAPAGSVSISGGEYQYIVANVYDKTDHVADHSGVEITGGKFAVSGTEPKNTVDVDEVLLGNDLTLDEEGNVVAAYAITITESTEGTVATSPANKFAEGETVTVTATPNEGYEVKSISVKDQTGGDVTTTSTGENQWTFQGGTSPVTVEVTFGAIDYAVSVTAGGQTTNYTSFDEAMEAALAAEGDVTVTLLSDGLQMTKQVVIDSGKNITITSAEGQKYTITGVEGDTNVNFLIKDGGSATLSNVKLDKFGATAATGVGIAVIKVDNNAGASTKLAVENVEITNYCRAAIDVRGGEYEITNAYLNPGTKTGDYLSKGILIGSGNVAQATGSIKNVTVEGIGSSYADWSTAGIEVWRNGQATIADVKITGESLDEGYAGAIHGISVNNASQYMVGENAPQVTITGAEIEVKDSAVRITGPNEGETAGVKKATVAISNSTLTGDIRVREAGVNESGELLGEITLNNSTVTGTVDGGTGLIMATDSTFTNADAVVADSNVVLVNTVLGEGSDAIIQGDGAYVALVTTGSGDTAVYTPYKSLQEAITAAQAGAVVTLLQDVEIDATGVVPGNPVGLIQIDKALTINGNNHSLSNVNVPEPAEDGTPAKISMITVLNGADVTINDLTIDGKNHTRHGLNIWNNAAQTGEVELNGVTIQNNVWYAAVVMGSTLSSNDLQTTGNGWGINVDTRITNNIQSTVSLGANVVIGEASSIVLDQEYDVANSTAAPAGSVSISGGEYQYIVANVDDTTGHAADYSGVEITGGKFAVNGTAPENAVDIAQDILDEAHTLDMNGYYKDAFAITSEVAAGSGSITSVPATKFAAGDTITATVEPGEGYMIKSFKVTKADDGTVLAEPTAQSPGVYVYEQAEAAAIKLVAEFEAVPTTEVVRVTVDGDTENAQLYDTFDQAMEAALKVSSDQSVVVEVLAPVTMTAPVVINGQNITIKGVGESQQTITGVAGDTNVRFSIMGGDVAFENVALEDFGYGAGVIPGTSVIKVEDGAAEDTNLSITDVSITDYARAAVDVRSGTLTITDAYLNPGTTIEPGVVETVLTKGILVGSGQHTATATITKVTVEGYASNFTDWDSSAIEIWRNGVATIEGVVLNGMEVDENFPGSINGISINNETDSYNNTLAAPKVEILAGENPETSITVKDAAIRVTGPSVDVFAPADIPDSVQLAQVHVSGGTYNGDIAVLESGSGGKDNRLLAEITVDNAEINGVVNGGSGSVIVRGGVLNNPDTVTVYSGNTLIGVEYNGEPVWSGTGVYVASYGNTAYRTLEEAIAAAPGMSSGESGTVYLLQSATLDGKGKGDGDGLLTITGKKVTIEGQGYSLSAVNVETNGEQGPSLISVEPESEIELKDLHLDGASQTKYGLSVWSTSSVTLTDVEISNNRWYGISLIGGQIDAENLQTSNNGQGGINVDTSKILAGGSVLNISGDQTNLQEMASIVYETSDSSKTVNSILSGGTYNYIVVKDADLHGTLSVTGGTFNITGEGQPADAVNVDEYTDDNHKLNAEGTVTDAYHANLPAAAEGGSITATPAKFFEGETVVLDVQRNFGFYPNVPQVTYTDKTGKEVVLSLTKVGDESWSFVAPAANVDVEVSFIQKNLFVVENESGTIKAPDYVAPDETATVIVTPSEGHEVTGLTVVDNEGNNIAYEVVAPGEYTFVMPGGVEVTVNANIVCDGGELCPSHKFTDLDKNQWYHEAVDWALENKVMNGYEGTTLFGPYDSLSREQAAAVMWNILGNGKLDAPAAPQGDVDQSAWYAPYVNWAVESGVMSGYNEDQFGIGATMTRQELAGVLGNAAGVDYDAVDDSNLRQFVDNYLVAEWAAKAMAWAVQEGVMSGTEGEDGVRRLEANRNITRAEMAAMIMNAVQADVMQLPTGA